VEELRLLAEDLGVGDAVVFAGPKPREEVPLYYRLGDVFVSASLSETQGLTYIEAMASRLPVIAKKDPCVSGFIEHGETGYLFEGDDELCDAMYNALTNHDQRLGIAENAFAMLAGLSSEAFAANVARLYEDVVRDHPPRRKLRLAVWRRVKRGVAVFTTAARGFRERL
jgi:1,2-diacylglycerol 3-alpha-glucosyltransferase